MRSRVGYDEGFEERNQSEVDDTKAKPIGGFFNATLYIRRRDLTKEYNPNVVVYHCPGCGPHFTSKEGFLYHVRNKVCYNKGRIRGQQRKELKEAIDLRVSNHIKRNSSSRKKQKRNKNIAIYPQVWLFLGFKIPATTKEKSKYPKKESDQIASQFDVENMNSKLYTLREEFQLQNSRILDHKLGTMYPQVYKCLGFIHPDIKKLEMVNKMRAEKKRLRAKLKRRSSRIKRLNAEQEQTHDTREMGIVQNEIPSGPMIDLQVLIDEANTGRYPSINRYSGKHPDECAICKSKDDLLFCEFCKNAMHIECAMSRISIKEPEPGDEFMCPSCAKKLISRRNRAEKRRLKKEADVRDRNQGAPEHREDEENFNYEQQLQESFTSENEVNAVAEVGQELSELLELLGDARNRMHQMSEIAKVNKLRRSQIC
eukprot:CAMPEP_0178900142 /NCGR_PEP_ID=MMETSP0786-20121207/3309_1 /TAXON_ID=186022 /ORGANISM="Thalassionema frauenfeldii, Strain CCMP 1798" /LENGTH=426 /DNA_ID=CAMNT_0020571113 /DNA_START=1280 /DNA_END=2560 /DNA_ORIENTATION=-